MKGLFKLLFWLTVVASIFYLIGWAFLFEVHTAEDNKMAPNIIEGDKFLVFKHATLETGTPTVCTYPKKAKKVMGRIVATEGDDISLIGGAVFLNGNQAEMTAENPFILVETKNSKAPQTFQFTEMIETLGMIRYRIVLPTGRRIRQRNMTKRAVKEGEAILIADNRGYGRDSRSYGPVKISSCIGRALLIYHPAESLGDAGRSSRWFRIIR